MPATAVALLKPFTLLGLVAGLLRLLHRRRRMPRGAPFLRGNWLVGNLSEVLRSLASKRQGEMTLRTFQLMDTRTYIMNLPFRPWIVNTMDSENVEHILKTNFVNYPKGEFFTNTLKELLGQGIFNADGEWWHMQRKTSSKMFTSKLFKEHIWVVVRRNALKVRDIAEGIAPGEVVDVFNLMNRFTLDTIGEIGFGKCIDSLDNPSSPFLQSFDRAQQITFMRFVSPFWRFARFFQIGHERETREHFDRLDSYSRSVVRELRTKFERGGGKSRGVAWEDIEARKSFLGLFLEDAKSRGQDISEDSLRDLVLNFLIAGRDTTAQALSWTIYCLARYPRVEARARREICDVCGVRGPAYEDMNNLPYLQGVLYEAMRLFPSVPFDTKIATADDTWPDGTFIPRGAQVVYNIYSMGRDKRAWGDDAEVFRPERWLEMKEIPSPYAYPVFNAGPRECLGKRLALVEMKACLATLLPNVSFQLAISADDVTCDTQLTLGMARGLPCTVVPIAEKYACHSSAASTVTQSECATSTSGWTSTPSEATTEPVGPCVSAALDSHKLEVDEQCLIQPLTRPVAYHDVASLESSHESGVDGHLHTGRHRKGGRSRQRSSRFWSHVRQPSPERYF